jgi:hypothetical protein
MRVFPIYIAFAGTFLLSQFAWAEGTITAGPGLFGANRRVLTQGVGYTGVRGSFSVSNLPTDLHIASQNFVPGSLLLGSNYIYDGNAANSKPTFYLGCSSSAAAGGSVEVDAGIVYEPRAITISKGSVAPPGWGVFVRYTGSYAPSGVYVTPQGGWRAGPTVSVFNLSWRMYQRYKFGIGQGNFGGFLDVEAVGADAQPVDPNYGGSGRIYARSAGGDDLIANTTSGMAVKRVVGVSQGGKGTQGTSQAGRVAYMPNNGVYELDGTYFRSCAFGGYQGAKGGEFLQDKVSGDRTSATGWLPLAGAALDQSSTGTGYYPPGKDQFHGVLLRPLNTARPVVEFPGIAEPNYPSPGNNSRYENEVVSVNLRPFRIIEGSDIVPAG